MAYIDIDKLAEKIVDIVAEWEGYSTSSLSGLRAEIKSLLKTEAIND